MNNQMYAVVMDAGFAKVLSALFIMREDAVKEAKRRNKESKGEYHCVVKIIDGKTSQKILDQVRQTVEFGKELDSK